ncbi:site-specific integrase [Vibrio parahaemolyticus]|nr:site-specific integrase [Vibrio parahaemolyticus]EJC6741405.1 site-specific integrase [Vibrio parahaemolyticus]EJC6832646.1 site-specific integrase [Vibrio parahaemolyticus]EJC6839843.1 site-specific integrase [Vibrio parahaemolyticus]MBM4809314.1 site-specific integrase [Vibrio parahaemolyticus]
MLIERKLITYLYERIDYSHYILNLKINDKIILMTAVNVFLKERTYKSLKTSERYSNILKRFFDFIISNNANITQNFWREVTDSDIREWQGYIIKNRDNKNKKRPKDDTVYLDACIVFDFYSWAERNHFPVLINSTSVDWKFNFRDESKLLSSKGILSGSVPDYANIDIRNTRIKQFRNSSSNKSDTIMEFENIKALVNSYSDPVYPVMFLLALATGMREQGVCSFPYIGIGENDHIRTYPEIKNSVPKDPKEKTPKTFPFTTIEKGNKQRTLQVNMSAWKVICIIYLPLYYRRKKLFKNKFPNKNVDAVFFLNKAGKPVTPKMVSDATNRAKKKLNDQHFHWSFHSTRDWYATMFIIKHLTREQINAAHYDAAIEDALRKQLGHSDIRTTYMHYIRVASLLLATRNGELDFSLGNSDDFWNNIAKTIDN